MKFVMERTCLLLGEKTEAQKKAQQKYMERFAIARVRMNRERYDAVQAHAEAHDESVSGFINRAITETMERDSNPSTNSKNKERHKAN